MDYVLDNSVSMRWILPTGKLTDQEYANSVLNSMEHAGAIVPAHWHLEAVNALLTAAERKEIDAESIGQHTEYLDSLQIAVDLGTSTHASGQTLHLAMAHKLSSYDAAYLELAMRLSLPLATLDKDLAKAAKEAGVRAYLR